MRFLSLLGLLVVGVRADAAEPAGIEFFEKSIRPVLSEHCYSCHGDKKQEAGLRLDSREAILKGRDAGPVVISGEPDKSKLITVIEHTGAIKMPPRGKLSANAVADMREWIRRGLPYPPTTAIKKADSSKHWAFQPVRAPEGSPSIDQFVEKQLRDKGLAFAPAAPPAVLIRRAYHDLIGLPPTADEIAAFEKAFAADRAAWSKLIDKLLASPRYGEAQARHWLDLARYADTKGYVFLEDRNYPFAYTYRDWVINAFNSDMPYDRFVQLQIAADRIAPPESPDLAAMGFLTVGRRFLNNVHDIIDDRLDVVSRSFLGLTIACARCHDHKYDPIPAKDYYSLYGVFASSTEPKDLPLIGKVGRTPEVVAFEKELTKREDEVKTLTSKLLKDRIDKLKQPASIAAYLLAVQRVGGQPNEKVQAYLRERDLNPYMLTRWREFVQRREKEPLFTAWKALSRLPEAEFATTAPAAFAKLQLEPAVAEAFKGAKLVKLDDLAAIYGKLLVTEATKAGGPLDVPVADAGKLFQRDDTNKQREAQKKVDAFKANSPAAPPRAMVLTDLPTPTSPYVFLRGNPGNRGPDVTRQFLEVLSGPNRQPFTDGSGRLELARAITDPANPLTARVMVNRIWGTHFGYGLVRSPSDFGVRSDPPTHPELLDMLASQFVKSGWSMKAIHRQIMLSNTYQQSSDVSPEIVRVDPENRLLSHQTRRRLEFEALRDSMLHVVGRLDTTPGGKSIDLFKEPFPTRRTVYGFIDRQNLPGTFRIFDFASPDQHSPQRFTTTVPQQALFLMNSPFVIEQARHVIARADLVKVTDPLQRITLLSKLILGRAPTDEEQSAMRAYVEQATDLGSFGGWQQLAQALLVSNEFVFVD